MIGSIRLGFDDGLQTLWTNKRHKEPELFSTMSWNNVIGSDTGFSYLDHLPMTAWVGLCKGIKYKWTCLFGLGERVILKGKENTRY